MTISSRYFETFYRSLSANPDESVVALLRDDGTLLVRFPALPEQPPHLSPTSSLLQAARSGALSGVFEATSTTDRHRRLAGFRRLRDVPLLVSYAIDTSVYLREWYLHLAFFATLSLLASGAIVLAGRAMQRDAARTQAALRELVEETGRRRQGGGRSAAGTEDGGAGPADRRPRA